jgi:hypothetical protein
MSKEQIITEWIDKITLRCRGDGVNIRLWMGAGGWIDFGDRPEFNSFSDYCVYRNMKPEQLLICTGGSDLNLYGMQVGPENSRWQKVYEFKAWEIPLHQLADPEFQKEFEYEYNFRLVNKIFS